MKDMSGGGEGRSSLLISSCPLQSDWKSERDERIWRGGRTSKSWLTHLSLGNFDFNFEFLRAPATGCSKQQLRGCVARQGKSGGGPEFALVLHPPSLGDLIRLPIRRRRREERKRKQRKRFFFLRCALAIHSCNLSTNQSKDYSTRSSI